MVDQTTRELLDSPIALYFHIPFCKKKCNYCDFTSYPIEPFRKRIQEYFDVLDWELTSRVRNLRRPPKLYSIYFGGGTPSLIPPQLYEKLLKRVESLFQVCDFRKIEITIEANPESVTPPFCEAISSIGVNRLSIGIQSLDNCVLKRMGRIHTVEKAYESLAYCRKCFGNISCDFILGYERNLEEMLRQLRFFLHLFHPEHLSFYPLETHSGSILENEINQNPDGFADTERVGDFLFTLRDYLQSEGYFTYETSSYALPGFFSFHNLAYWENKEYLGVGVSAGGHIDRYRYVNTCDIEEYFKTVPENGLPTLSYESHNGERKELLETLFMGLRTRKGLFLQEIRYRFPEAFSPSFQKFLYSQPEFIFCEGRLRLSEDAFYYNAKALQKIVNFNE